jgi:polysaccharide biosynthesis protein PslJ
MDLWGAMVVLRRQWLATLVVVLLWVPAVLLAYHSLRPMYASTGAIVLTAPKNAVKYTDGGLVRPQNPLGNVPNGLAAELDTLIEQIQSPSVTESSALLSDGTSFFSVLRGGSLALGDPNSPMLTITGESPVPEQSQEIVDLVIDLIQHNVRQQQLDLGVPTSFLIRVDIVMPPITPELLKGSRTRAAGAALVLGGVLALFTASTVDRLRGRRRSARRRDDRAAPNLLDVDGFVPMSRTGGHHYSIPPWPVSTTTRAGLDGAALAGIFVLSMTSLPAKLVVQALPVSISLATAIALSLGVWWLCTHLVTDLGMAKGWNPVRAALLFYAITQTLTYGAASAGYLPPDELHATDHTLVTVAGCIALALVVCDAVQRMDRLHLLLKITVCGTTFLALVGILQALIGLDLTRYLQPPGFRSSTDFAYVLSRGDYRRPAGTAAHPIEYGAACTMILPLALYYAFRPRIGTGARMLWMACAGLMAASAVLSLSRSAMLCLAVLTPILLFAWPPCRRLMSVAVLIVSVVGLGLAAPNLSATLSGLFLGASSDSSILARLRDYDAAFVEVARHPLLGRGLGTWLSSKYNVLDNQYLHTLIENGVIGLAAFTLLFLVSVVCLVRIRSEISDPSERELALTLVAALSVGVVGSFTYDSLTFTTATGLTFLLIGAVGALIRIVRGRRRPPPLLVPVRAPELTTCPIPEPAGPIG